MAERVDYLMSRNRQAWERVLATPDGRAVMWDILSATGLFRSTLSPESMAVTAYNEGRRSIGLTLVGDHIDGAGDGVLSQIMTEGAARDRAMREAIEADNERHDTERHDGGGFTG